MSDNGIAALAIVCIFGLPVAAWIVFRALRFVERIEMIKRGMIPPPEGSWFGSRRAWRDWSQQQQQQGRWANAPWQQQGAPPPGPGPSPGPMPSRQQGCWNGDDDAQTTLFKGIRLALIGFAILIGLSFLGGTPGTPEFHGGPWLLGGLIPMFVGIAQIIIALLSGAQLPGTGPRATFIPPPPPPGPDMPPPPTGPSSWQQPGRRFEELQKPAPPPDLK